jgi:hypothetical protein
MTRTHLLDLEEVTARIGLVGRYAVIVADRTVARSDDRATIEDAVRALNILHPKGPPAVFSEHRSSQ